MNDIHSISTEKYKNSKQATRYPTEVELAAYNETGHALIGRFQGRAITSIRVGSQEWQTWDDHMNMIGIHPDIEPNFPYTELGYSAPLPNWLPSRENDCTFKIAGVVAEKMLCERLGVSSSEVQTGKRDILEAEALARSRYPNDLQAQRAMLLNAETEVRKILSHPACWHAAEILAGVVAEVLVREPVLDGDRVHEIIHQALVQAQNSECS